MTRLVRRHTYGRCRTVRKVVGEEMDSVLRQSSAWGGRCAGFATSVGRSPVCVLALRPVWVQQPHSSRIQHAWAPIGLPAKQLEEEGRLAIREEAGAIGALSGSCRRHLLNRTKANHVVVEPMLPVPEPVLQVAASGHESQSHPLMQGVFCARNAQSIMRRYSASASESSE